MHNSNDQPRALGLHSLERKVLIGFGSAAILLLLMGTFSYVSVVRFRADARQVDHTHQVLTALTQLLADLTAAESSQRGFLMTGQEEHQQSYDAAVLRIQRQIPHLRDLTQDNPTQQKNLDELVPLVADRLNLMQSRLALRQNQGWPAIQALIGTDQGKSLREDTQRVVRTMENEEQGLLEEREARAEESSLLTRTTIATSGLLAITLLVAALFLVQRGFAHSRRAETELRLARDTLEERVRERTAEVIKGSAAVRAGEERMARIVDSAMDAIISVDEQQRITIFNPAAERMFGCPASDAFGAPLARFLPERFRTAHAEHLRAFGQNSVTRRTMGGFSPLRGLRTNGQEFPIEASISQIDVGGRKLFTAIVRDVTETSKASETSGRLAAIVESSDDAIMSKTLDGVITSWNPAAERLFGYTAAEAIGKPMLTIFPPEHVEEEKDILARIARGESIDHYETQRVRKDGKCILVAVTISPLRDESGRVVGASKIARDITALRQAEALQMRSQKLEALGTLAGGIAHDFNNILAAINGNATLALAQFPPDHPAQACLLEIEKAGTRAAELVRRILSFSRPQDHNIEVQSLEPVVEEALKLVRATLPAMIEIRAAFNTEQAQARVDSTQIHQVIVNLATNAAHAIGDTQGLIEVKLDAPTVTESEILLYGQVPAGEYLRLSVSDNGCGMDSETVQRIFDPFFTTKPVGKGTGLGLSVVHGIVAAHQGILKVYSEPGKGTTFHVYLPAVRTVTLDTRPTKRQSPTGLGERILFVDDEGVLVFVGTMSLEQNGYRVTGMPNGESALRELRQNPGAYDAVITDLSMPGLSGLQLAHQIRKVRADLPVILLSGYVNPEDQVRADRLGIRAILTKPVNSYDLLNALGAIFQSMRT